MTARYLLNQLRNIENKDVVICIGLRNYGLSIATNICVEDGNFIINSMGENNHITLRKLVDYLIEININYVIKINFIGLHNIYSISIYKSKYLILGS